MQPSISLSTTSVKMAILVLCLMAAALCWPVAGQAGRIEGRIRVGGESTSPGPNPYPGQLGSRTAGGEVVDSEVREVAIYLRDLRVGDPASDTPDMRQESLRFDPAVLAIPTGTTVNFPNLDPVFHNVFSYSKTRRFDLGRYGKGKSKSVTFDEPGLVEVFCDVHASMQAFILIVDSDFITQPGKDGGFVIDGVPEGEQTLVIWHPDRGEQEFKITVGEETVRFDLSF